jgi:hypothetical protein
MTRQSWRAYRTYFPLGRSRGVADSVVCRTGPRLENLLIQSKVFHLPGKKTWHTGGTQFAGMVVDVAESPGERPQKHSGAPPAGRRSAPPRKPRVQNPGGEVSKQAETFRLAMALAGESLQLELAATQMTFATGPNFVGLPVGKARNAQPSWSHTEF